MNGTEAAPALAEDTDGCFMLAGRGYGNGGFRRIPEANNNILVISGRKNRKEAAEYDTQRYKKRSFIGRIFEKPKENRRLAVRYEKPAPNFFAFILVAFIKILLC